MARPLTAPAGDTRLVRAGPGLELSDEPPRRGRVVATYPEWSERTGEYRPEWCTVRAMPGDPSDRARTAAHAARPVDLRRAIAALRLELVHVRRCSVGDDLDLDALVAARIDAAADGDADERVYIAGRRLARDLSALVLVDTSGSTHGGGSGALLELQRATAAGLIDAFEANEDRVACIGFRSFGRHRIEVIDVKHFAERFDTPARQRLAALRAGGFTRLGAGIRHAAQLLRADAATRHRLLIVLTDGFPFDTGYEGEHAVADVRRAFAEARGHGIGSLALSLGDAGARSLADVFGPTTHVVVAQTGMLARLLAPACRDALASADRRTVEMTGRR